MKKERLTELGMTEENAALLLEELAKENTERDAAIEGFEQEKNNIIERYENEIMAINVDREVEKQLTSAGAKNIKAVKALLNLKDAELTKNGISGLKEQIKKLKSSSETDFLFDKISFKGVRVGESEERQTADIGNMNYSQLCAYLDENPQARI